MEMSEQEGIQNQEDQINDLSTDQPTDAPTEEPKASNDPPEWFKKRLGEITAARRQAEAEAERLKQENEALKSGQQSSNPDVEALARQYAQQIASEQVKQQQFIEKIGEIERKAKEEFGAEYDSSVNNLAMAGVQSNDFLHALTRVPGAEKIITYLGKSENLDKAVRLASLPPVEMGIELAELSRTASKAFSKQKSNAPAPIEAVGGRSLSSGNAEPPRSDTAAWIKWRNETKRTKR